VLMKTALAALAVHAAVTPAAADYPERPIRIVVSLAPGSVADTVARVIAKPLSEALGRPVIVENKPGGDGVIAVEAVRSAPADGYTLLWGQGGPLIGVPLVNKNVTYDAVTDFTPLSLLGRLTTCLFAHPDVLAKNVPELVDYARANPGKLSYATNALGEVVAAAQLSKAAGITMVRVPYKGGPQSLLDLTAGRVQLGFNALAAGLPHVQQGRLRMLATLQPRRSAAIPDVPTVIEAGYPQVTFSVWFGLFGPAQLPKNIVDRLTREVNAALAQPELRAQFERHFVQPEGSTPQGLADLVKDDAETWRKVVREAGITPQ
jgi:tripartite-type tricarboxylate transporter receptor subunit TctC